MTECPSAPLLLDFALGTGDESQADAIGRHIKTCTECAGFLADVSTFPDEIEPREGAATVSDEEIEVDRDALRLATGDDHLTLKLLAAYCDGSLTTVSEELVMDHLAVCKTCMQAMVELTDRPNPEPSWTDFVVKHGHTLEFSGDEG